MRYKLIAMLGAPVYEEQLGPGNALVFLNKGAYVLVLCGNTVSAVDPERFPTLEAAKQEIARMRADTETPEFQETLRQVKERLAGD